MLVINGNPREPGAVSFSPEAVSLLNTFPPTPESLKAAFSVGHELGVKLVEFPEGPLSISKVALGAVSGHQFPIKTTTELFEGVLDGAERRFNMFTTLGTVYRAGLVIRNNREALRTEALNRFGGHFDDLNAEVGRINAALGGSDV